MIGVVVFTLVEWLNYYLVYRNVFGITFIKKKIPYIAVIILISVLQAICFLKAGNEWRDINIILLGLVVFLALAKSKRVKVGILFPVVILLSSLVNVLGSYGLAAILGIHQDVLCDSWELTALAECTGIIVFTIYGKVASKKLPEDMKFSWWQICAIVLGPICCIMLIGFAQGVWNDDHFIFELKEEVLTASILLTFLFIALMVIQQMIRSRALKIQLENEEYRIFLQGQHEHIKMILEEDEHRRRLKHDLKAHILALSTYAQQGEVENLQAYLRKMDESFCVEDVKRYTGVLGVDAIINDIYKKAKEQNVTWSFTGTLPEKESISVFEWCVLFSNLLKNALEATQESYGEKKIEVNISNMREQVVLIVRNTCNEKLQGTMRPQTVKLDKVKHGLGLKNVEEIVNKQDGTISYFASEGWFEIDVVL